MLAATLCRGRGCESGASKVKEPPTGTREFVALYEYECKVNRHRFEVRHGMNESPVHSCLECSADVRRVITAPAILFKGGGFYVTDSRKKSEAVSESKLSSEGGELQPVESRREERATDSRGSSLVAPATLGPARAEAGEPRKGNRP